MHLHSSQHFSLFFHDGLVYSLSYSGLLLCFYFIYVVFNSFLSQLVFEFITCVLSSLITSDFLDKMSSRLQVSSEFSEFGKGFVFGSDRVNPCHSRVVVGEGYKILVTSYSLSTKGSTYVGMD